MCFTEVLRKVRTARRTSGDQALILANPSHMHQSLRYCALLGSLSKDYLFAIVPLHERPANSRGMAGPPEVRVLSHGPTRYPRSVLMAWTQATALMFRMPRLVTVAVTMCAGSLGPIRIGPTATAPVTALTRL